MYQFETKIRVRYAETDQMGFVYYGNYAAYFEVARVESLRNLGYTYKKIEELGVFMPVLELKTKFIKPARYDDLLRIKVTIPTNPASRMIFHYEVFNEENLLLNVGETTLVFIDKQKGRPCEAPKELIDIMKPYFNETTDH